MIEEDLKTGKLHICPNCGSRDMKENIDLIFGDTYYTCWNCLRTFAEEPEFEEVHLDRLPPEQEMKL